MNVLKKKKNTNNIIKPIFQPDVFKEIINEIFFFQKLIVLLLWQHISVISYYVQYNFPFDENMWVLDFFQLSKLYLLHSSI